MPLIDATFVRVLKDSDTGSKPYFRKGDILRIIGDRWRGDLFYELLPLKPPTESGRVLRSIMEGVDQQTANEVGEEAKTKEENEAFLCAIQWDD